MKSIVIFLLGGLFLLAPSFAHANDFNEPSHRNLFNTMIRFGAMNINKDDIIDEYLMETECPLYKKFYLDDFKWQKIREAVRQKIKQEAETYPIAYTFDTKLQLGRYDFKEKIYRFSEKTMVKNVNAITFYRTHEVVCGDQKSSLLPTSYRAVLDKPIYIDGFPLSEGDAKALLNRMENSKNEDRLIYARFNLRITFVAPLEKEAGNASYKQHGQSIADIRLDAHMDDAEFYEDPEYTKLIYTYREGRF